MFIYQSPTNNYFNWKWYKNTYHLYNLDEKQLYDHFQTIGYKLNYNPSLYFNTKWYKETYQLTEDINPLEHFIANLNHSIFKPNEKCKYFIRDSFNKPWTNITGEFIPLKNEKKKINLILPEVNNFITGGPQSIYYFANSLANYGLNVRIISMYQKINMDSFLKEINQRMDFNNNIEIETLYNNDLTISFDDIFIISAWWTAYPLKHILGYLNIQKFVWIIQENELIFHMGDSIYQKALDTYNMNYFSLVHSSILLDGLKSIQFGPFKNNDYLINDTCFFEPSIRKDLFYPINKNYDRKIKIIFYSRNGAPRNLHGLIMDTLKNSFQNKIIDNINFEIIGFGEQKGKHQICHEFWYEDLGFLDIENYSQLFREADILINLLMSPILGPLPLEFTSCNGICIHNNYLHKNLESVSRYSDKIIMCEPNVLDLTEGLENAIQIVRDDTISKMEVKLIYNSWDESFQTCINFLKKKLDLELYI